MDNIQFYNSFSFRRIKLRNARRNDNSKGIPCHFIARLRVGTARIVTSQREELHLEAGDVFYLPMGLRYQSFWYPDGDLVEWDSFAFSLFPTDRETTYAMQKLPSDERIDELFDAIASDATVSAKSVGLFYLLFDRIAYQMSESAGNRSTSIITRAMRYMESHLDDLRIPDLAKHCNMSESGLYALFRRYTSATPIDMKNKMISERAVMLLQTTSLSVEEISARFGFSNPAYFRKIIKYHTKKTPSAIRRNSRSI